MARMYIFMMLTNVIVAASVTQKAGSQCDNDNNKNMLKLWNFVKDPC